MQEVLASGIVPNTGLYMFDYPLDIVEGDKITVILDGVKYNRTAFIADGILVVGNHGIGNFGENTGEPFVYRTEKGGMTVFMAIGSNFSIIKNITTIDQKYLPGPVVVDLDELGVMNAVKGLMATNGGVAHITIDPDKLWNKVRNAPQIICKFGFSENKSNGTTTNAYLTGWYHVPATRMDFVKTGYDAVSVTFTFVAMNSFARVTLAANIFYASFDETGHIIYPTNTDVLLDLYPLTPAPGNF